MALIWKETLSVGVNEIDNQHKELFKRINNLLDACTQGKGREEIKRTMGFLSDYVISHFGIEEELMNRYNYPDYASHRERHEKFKKEFAELKMKIEKEVTGLLTTLGTNHLLIDWWLNHIGKVDKALGAFLSGKSV
jgi:hemerythrin